MPTKRLVIWGSAVIVVGVLLFLDAANAFPEWLLVGPVGLGVAGTALLIDQIACVHSRKGGFLISLLMIGLSAGTVTQDAELIVDEWSVWPFVAGAIALGWPLEILAARHPRSTRPTHPRLPAKAA